MSKKTICLNMIVKNESHIILDTLNVISKYIDYWVICDTGSTDGTQELIKDFFLKHNIPGDLLQHEWIDFGHNRTLAIQACKGKADYIFIIDADDTIVGDLQFPSDMNADAYYLKFGKNFTWNRVQIFSNLLDWKYIGVIHEFAVCISKKDTNIQIIEGNYYIDGRCMGARSKDPKKYLKDAELAANNIDKSLAEGDTYMAARYTFYAAQGYTDYGDLENGLKYYKLRITQGGWVEEVYYSYFKIAKNIKGLNTKNMNDPSIIELIEQSFLAAYNYLPTRAEPLYELALMFRLLNNFEKSYHYSSIGLKIEFPKNQRLFISKDIYDWRLKDECSISAFYLKKYQQSFDLCQELLHYLPIPESDRPRIEQNSDFCVPHIKDILTKYNVDIINRINSYKSNRNLVTFVITTYNRFHTFQKTFNSFINCCKDIFLIDKWICIDDNTNSDDRLKMQKLYPFFTFIWKDPSQSGHLASMNILIDKVTTPFLLHMVDDWQFFERKDYIKPALVILQEHIPLDSSKKSIAQVSFNRNYIKSISERGIPGGVLSFTHNYNYRYLIHEYCIPNSKEYTDFFIRHNNKPANCYWPHFSLSPSLTNTSIFRILGNFSLNNNYNNFELDFAHRYVAANFITAFFDTISCLYIGNLPNEPYIFINDNDENDKSNSYKNNILKQFTFHKFHSPITFPLNIVEIYHSYFLNSSNIIVFICHKSTLQYFTEYIASLQFFSFIITFHNPTDLSSLTDLFPDCFFVYATDLLYTCIFDYATRPNCCLFNSEQMSLTHRRDPIINFLKNNGKIINYNNTNANILLNQNSSFINQMLLLPYICNKNEQSFLHNLLITSPKLYDFAIVGTLTPYRKFIIEQLYQRGLKILVINNSFDNKRDKNIAQCSALLNIHANSDYQVFESIRCNRWLDAGMTVISETCIDQITHNNLSFVNYHDIPDFCSTFISKKSSNINIINICTSNDSLTQFNKWTNSNFIIT